jgi:multicomponent Na+:H+ antiporter subunit A
MMVALGVGVTLTLIGLSVQGKRVFEPISSFYENAYELSGAKNIVNAILVDFRGFDTMLEIVVLFSAGIGVYTLIKLRQAKGDES